MQFKITILAIGLLLACLCIIASRAVHDMQKEAQQEAKEAHEEARYRAWLGSVGDKPPGYKSGAPGGVKYFDPVGGGK